jgi:hypothetical protein
LRSIMLFPCMVIGERGNLRASISSGTFGYPSQANRASRTSGRWEK